MCWICSKALGPACNSCPVVGAPHNFADTVHTATKKKVCQANREDQSIAHHHKHKQVLDGVAKSK
jgi:hypothetical protein